MQISLYLESRSQRYPHEFRACFWMPPALSLFEQLRPAGARTKTLPETPCERIFIEDTL